MIILDINHQPPITQQELASLQYLLLSHEHDIVLLNEVQAYFYTRISKATKRSIFDVSSTGVASCYAGALLQQQYHSILQAAEVAKAKKIAEGKRVVETVRTLQQDIASLNSGVCNCEYSRKGRKSNPCSICRQIQSKKSQIEHIQNVEVYEWPLPSDKSDADVVVFHKYIPSSMQRVLDSFAIANLVVSSKFAAGQIGLYSLIHISHKSKNAKKTSLGQLRSTPKGVWNKFLSL